MSRNLSCRDSVDSRDNKISQTVVDKIVNNYEELLRSIEYQVNFYKSEHEAIRQEIQIVINENLKLGTHLNQFTRGEATRQQSSEFSEQGNYKKFTDEIIQNLRQRIEILSQEKATIEELWKTSQGIISNLTLANKTNPNTAENHPFHGINNEYHTAIKALDTTITRLRSDLEAQIITNKNLCHTKVNTEKNYEILQRKYNHLVSEQHDSLHRLKETERSLASAKQKLCEIMKVRADLEQSVQRYNLDIETHIYQKTEALEKVQDALIIAETALIDKNAALCRERSLKEECDLLATSIGQVMEEAAIRVDRDINKVKGEYNVRINRLNGIIRNLKSALQKQTERTAEAERCSKYFEDQLTNLTQNNCQLDSDLHVASQTIISMELKIETMEKLMDKEEESNRICEKRAHELQEFLKHNRQIKGKWRETVDEVTTMLQAEIQHLKSENVKLGAENNQLTARLAYVEKM